MTIGGDLASNSEKATVFKLKVVSVTFDELADLDFCAGSVNEYRMSRRQFVYVRQLCRRCTCNWSNETKVKFPYVHEALPFVDSPGCRPIVVRAFASSHQKSCLLYWKWLDLMAPQLAPT